jgi:hypothetical protein
MKKLLFPIIIMFFSISLVQAQKTANEKDLKEKLYVKLKDGEKPTIYVNGKIFDFPMDLIDQSKITSVFVVKKQEALKKYNAPNGVVLITTKILDSTDVSELEITDDDKKIGGINGPKVIINGKVSGQEALKKLTPDNIEKVEVVKGEVAIKKYNAPNGVIIITTKKM